MTLSIIFSLSGAGILILVAAKRIEERHRRTFLLLRIISRGDERARELGHLMADKYEEGKSWLTFFVDKQLPLKTRSYWSKFLTKSREVGERHLEKIRDARILNSKDRHGISEFFKSIESTEKGTGSIEEPWEEGSQEDR